MEKLIVTKENFVGLTKCKDTDQPKVSISGSFYFYLENVEIGGDRKNPKLYYDIDNTLYNVKSNHPLHEGDFCIIEIESESLEYIDSEILLSLENEFDELFEDLYDKDAEDYEKTLRNLPY